METIEDDPQEALDSICERYASVDYKSGLDEDSDGLVFDKVPY